MNKTCCQRSLQRIHMYVLLITYIHIKHTGVTLCRFSTHAVHSCKILYNTLQFYTTEYSSLFVFPFLVSPLFVSYLLDFSYHFFLSQVKFKFNVFVPAGHLVLQHRVKHKRKKQPRKNIFRTSEYNYLYSETYIFPD